jgi:hypothetical protein
LVASVLAAAPARAQVVDQQQTQSNSLVGSIGDRIYQSFTPTTSTVAGVSIKVTTAVLPCETCVVHQAGYAVLYDAMPWNPLDPGAGNPNAHLLASAGYVNYSIPPGQSAWVVIFFASAVAVSPGHQYLFGLTAGKDQWTNDSIGYQTTDLYAGGTAYRAAENPYNVSGPMGGDVAFIEYATLPVVAPEPATFGLLGTGLLVLAGMIRRRVV